jgi:hypothetical protein
MCIMYVSHLRGYKCVFKHLISGIPRKKSPVKKRDIDDF